MPKLMYNLIFIGQLDDKGHNVTFASSAWKITKDPWFSFEEIKLEHCL